MCVRTCVQACMRPYRELPSIAIARSVTGTLLLFFRKSNQHAPLCAARCTRLRLHSQHLRMHAGARAPGLIARLRFCAAGFHLLEPNVRMFAISRSGAAMPARAFRTHLSQTQSRCAACTQLTMHAYFSLNPRACATSHARTRTLARGSMQSGTYACRCVPLVSASADRPVGHVRLSCWTAL